MVCHLFDHSTLTPEVEVNICIVRASQAMMEHIIQPLHPLTRSPRRLFPFLLPLTSIRRSIIMIRNLWLPWSGDKEKGLSGQHSSASGLFFHCLFYDHGSTAMLPHRNPRMMSPPTHLFSPSCNSRGPVGLLLEDNDTFMIIIDSISPSHSNTPAFFTIWTHTFLAIIINNIPTYYYWTPLIFYNNFQINTELARATNFLFRRDPSANRP
jgi:hypothetical protein